MYQIGDEVVLKKPDWFPENGIYIEQGTSGKESVCFIEEMLNDVGKQTRIKKAYFAKKIATFLKTAITIGTKTGWNLLIKLMLMKIH